MRNLKRKWYRANARRTGAPFGILVDKWDETLTNLRFADDLLLLAQSPRDIGKLLRDLQAEAKKFGLKLNSDKTKVFFLDQAPSRFYLQLEESRVEVLTSEASERYLGRNRISAGWAAFTTFKSELCSKRCTFAQRARLFHSLVTLCVLYGSGAWTMTGEMEHSLRVAQRRMLRTMFGGPRLLEEIWVEYVTRTTHKTEDKMKELAYEDWVTGSRRRKWRLAGKTANCSDNRWSKRLFHWRPLSTRGRSVGRPCTRWRDQLVKTAAEDFDIVAKDKQLWTLLEEMIL